jgi:hypothetical protein
MAERILQTYPRLWPVFSVLFDENSRYDEHLPIDRRAFRIELAMIVGALGLVLVVFQLLGNA